MYPYKEHFSCIRPDSPIFCIPYCGHHIRSCTRYMLQDNPLTSTLDSFDILQPLPNLRTTYRIKFTKSQWRTTLIELVLNLRKVLNVMLTYLWVSRHFESGFSGFSVVTSVPPPPLPPLPPVCSNPLHLYNVLIFFLSVSLNPFLKKTIEYFHL